MTEGGVIRNIENYGEHQLAYRMRKNGEWFNRGRYV
jgi:ribosomal protein S6